ncbi:MAG: hypothetical protein HZB10_02890, partial [Candidatus Yonathbacteria bacterium]|nr:hypothetical protein [Candidatus Yonathbacteria bacterium]
MKFICTKENFIQCLKSVGHLSGKTPTLPILNNILLKTVQGTIQCISTNLEIGITASMRAKIEEEGGITLPARVLLEYIQLLPAETMTVSTEGTDVLIQSKSQKTKIRGTGVDDFPALPPITTQETAEVSVGDLHAALTEVVFAAAQDENRVDISGMYASFTPGDPEGQCTLAATDSYRLAERSITTAHGQKGEIVVIIPSRTAHELLRITGDQ